MVVAADVRETRGHVWFALSWSGTQKMEQGKGMEEVAVRPPIVVCLKRASMVDVLCGESVCRVPRRATFLTVVTVVGHERTASRHMSVPPPLNDCRIGFPCGDTVGASFFNSD